jgi:hypothetical protein
MRIARCHGGHINLYHQNVIPSPYTKWYHKFYYIIVWVLMEIVYSIFIGMISSKIAGMIAGIGLQCRRDTRSPTPQLSSRFDSRATHARTLLPAALASVPFWFVLAKGEVIREVCSPYARACEKVSTQSSRDVSM